MIMTIAFVLFLSAINIWAVPTLIIALGATSKAYEILDSSAALGYVMLPAIFLVFSLSFNESYEILKRYAFWAFLLIPAFFFLYLGWSSNLIQVHPFNKAIITSWGYVSPTGAFFPLFLLWLESLMFVSLSLIIQFYRKTGVPVKRKQTLFLIAAILTPLVAGTITDGILPIFRVQVFPLAIPLTSIMALFIFYAIRMYGLFEIVPLSVIIKSIKEAVVTVNSENKIVSVNPEAEEMLGQKESVLLGKSIHKVLPLKDESENKVNYKNSPIYKAIMKKETIKSDNFSLLKKDRKTINISVNVSPIFSQNNVVGATILFRDITQQRAIDRAKSNFVSFTSHQLLNPLSVIRLYTELILEKNNLTQAKKYAQKIFKKSNEMVELIEDFLKMSRIELGVFEKNQEVVNVGDICNEIIKELSLRIQKKRLKIKTEFSTQVKKTTVNPFIVSQILQNLITNAVKYTSAGGKITVRLAAGKSLYIKVSDTGSGIPKEELEKIFTKFYKLKPADGETSHSLGIGLYMVKTLLDHIGGTIDVISKINKGTTFYVSIPIV